MWLKFFDWKTKWKLLDLQYNKVQCVNKIFKITKIFLFWIRAAVYGFSTDTVMFFLSVISSRKAILSTEPRL